jgi:hypothetical protein
MDDETTIAELTERVAMLEALVEKLAGEEPTTPPAPITPRSGGDDTTTASTPTTAGRPLPRRQMLGKAGAAAVGAVLGGAVAAVSTAGPAAAASGSFDSSTSDPALTAISTGSGAAIKATSSGSGRALDVDGSSQLRGPLEIMTSATTGLQITSTGVGELPDTGIQASASSVGVIADGAQWGVHGASDGVGVFGHGGNGYGILAVGAKANLHLMEPGDPYPAMVPPRSRTDAHESGEIYLDSNSDLWLCVADGTPGTWIHLGGPASSGTFTVLHRPVRVYTATAVTGIIHGIDPPPHRAASPPTPPPPSSPSTSPTPPPRPTPSARSSPTTSPHRRPPPPCAGATPKSSSPTASPPDSPPPRSPPRSTAKPTSPSTSSATTAEPPTSRPHPGQPLHSPGWPFTPTSPSAAPGAELSHVTTLSASG